jgi:hypothetical protein
MYVQLPGSSQTRLRLLPTKQWIKEQEQRVARSLKFKKAQEEFLQEKLAFQKAQEDQLWKSAYTTRIPCDRTSYLCGCETCKNLEVRARKFKIKPLELLACKIMDLDTAVFYWNDGFIGNLDI